MLLRSCAAALFAAAAFLTTGCGHNCCNPCCCSPCCCGYTPSGCRASLSSDPSCPTPYKSYNASARLYTTSQSK